jgi:hypothetical protein
MTVHVARRSVFWSFAGLVRYPAPPISPMARAGIRIELRTRTLGITPTAHIRYTVAVLSRSFAATSRTVSHLAAPLAAVALAAPGRGRVARPPGALNPRHSAGSADGASVANAVAKSFETGAKVGAGCDPGATRSPILTRACEGSAPPVIGISAVWEQNVGGSNPLAPTEVAHRNRSWIRRRSRAANRRFFPLEVQVK